jgi:hypothetical protein
MALSLEGFTTPEQNFGGLYKVSDNIRQDEARKEMERRRLEAGKAASSKFLSDYTDPEQFLTGTPQDDYVLKSINDIKYEGMDLINKGVDNNQLMFALQNRVSKLSQDSQKLKQINEQKKQAATALSKNPAIDINKFNNAFDEIYFETDQMGNRRIKDISKLEMKDYATEILNTKPIYTPAGFDAFVGKAGQVKERQSMTVKNSAGAVSKKDMQLVAPEFMQPEFDEKGVFTRQFVPKYQVAVDEDKPLIGKFMTGENRQVDAQIRLLDQNTFANLPNDAMAYVLQEAKQFAAENGIATNDPKVGLFARALAYDALKNSGKQKTNAEEIIVQQAAPAPKFTTNNYVNTKGEGGDFRDMYTPFIDNLKRFAPNEKISLENIDIELHDAILKKAGNATVMGQFITLKDVFVRNEGGRAKLYVKEGAKEVPAGELTQDFINLIGNEKLGVKNKQSATSSKSAPKPKAAPPSKEFKGVPQGGF